jgi:hypothetical protein
MGRKLYLLLMALIIMSGCTTTGGIFGPAGPTSAAGFEISPAHSEIMAEDLVGAMDGVIPTAQNLVLISNSPVMTPTIEGKLRARGYAVEVVERFDSSGSSLPVTYYFDRFEDGQIWAQLRVGSALEVSRLYQDGNGVLEPISPLTVRQLGAVGS